MSKANSVLVTRNGLTWLLIAQVLVIIPHLLYSPWWLLLLWAFCAVWRIQIYRMKFRFPKFFIKFGLMIGISVGIYFSRGTIVGLDGGVVLLIAAFSLKLLELKTRRDALVVIYLGFIAVVTAYLFDNSFLWVLYSLLPVTALLAALIGLHQTKLAANPVATIRLAGLLLLQAVPLMLVLFFFFPRFDPLWSLPMPKKQQATGLSNSMTPGELADMAQSAELVFRANFDEAIPPKNKLYWRAITLETYNGRTWSQAWDAVYADKRAMPYWSKNADVSKGVSYTVIMEPNSRTWVIALDTPDTLPYMVGRQVDFHLEREKPIESLYSYQITSWLDALREPGSTRRFNINLQLPVSQAQDPRARAFAVALKEKHQGDTQSIIQELLRHYKEQPYFYTLQTPDMGENSVDTFFFDNRSGFCEHYAGATTFILRAAGIPARVVLGYQGGEINNSGNFVQVRQFEAHAWVEYWEKDKGWITIDPTFQVAPDRILLGLNEALNPSDQQQLGAGGMFGYMGESWFSSIRMRWESFNNSWNLFMLGYNSDQQKGLLQKLVGKTDIKYLGIMFIIGAMVIVGLWVLFLLKPWKRDHDPILKYYQRFEKLMSAQGVSYYPGEGPADYGKRAARELPDYAEAIKEFSETFINQRYAQSSSEKQLQQAYKRLKKALSWKKKYFVNNS